jgi:enamine deaminase RidA (YjgF/YER057c/UK114 family)
MRWRSVAGAILTTCIIGSATCAATEDKPAAAKDAPGQDKRESSIRYVPMDAPAGMSQAVIVQGHPLVYTRQLLPLNPAGKLVGRDSVEKQIQQVLDNLNAVLTESGSNLGHLVRLNVYALAPSTVDRVRDQLRGRLPPTVRPTITAVLTPMPHRDALVAVDAVAVAAEKGETVALQRCNAVAGDGDYADAAVLPRGGVAYLSGVPAEAGLTVSAVDKSMSTLWELLGELSLSPTQVVQLKVFLRPASSADEVLRELKKYFPDQMTPPVVFVEWLAPPPIEIELIAQLPLTDEGAPGVQYYNPPEVRPMQVFSRVALVRTDRQIYISSLFSRTAGRGQKQALDVFDQLQAILEQTGSDLRHMAKATYYVCDDDSARGMDRVRLWRYDQDRPPAASKCMVHGVGQSGRSLTLDMIAVGSGQ